MAPMHMHTKDEDSYLIPEPAPPGIISGGDGQECK